MWAEIDPVTAGIAACIGAAVGFMPWLYKILAVWWKSSADHDKTLQKARAEAIKEAKDDFITYKDLISEFKEELRADQKEERAEFRTRIEALQTERTEFRTRIVALEEQNQEQSEKIAANTKELIVERSRIKVLEEKESECQRRLLESMDSHEKVKAYVEKVRQENLALIHEAARQKPRGK